MLEDESVESYVMWSKFNNREALLIPDIDAFVANVMPRHFREMKKVDTWLVPKHRTLNLMLY